MKTTIKEEVVEGVILKRTPYKENDMILHIYTKEYGKIGVQARGVRKITSKNARACQEMMISELSISLKKGLSSLIKASPVHYLRHIKESIDSEIIGNYILEYYYRYIEENQPMEYEYQILIDALNALDQGYQPLLVYLLFNVFVLDHNGVSIDVDGCVKCQSTKVVSISLEDGGYLCQDHISSHKVYSIDVLKAFRHIHIIPMNQIGQLHIEDKVIKELVPIMDYYIEEYTGISLRTKTFIQQIV
ncbi:MAG: DNA repair protein RecO [Erysipelotrichales bacterium]|nr:DNA repair protein RecO [Erysipelotrichales bacterium]